MLKRRSIIHQDSPESVYEQSPWVKQLHLQTVQIDMPEFTASGVGAVLPLLNLQHNH